MALNSYTVHHRAHGLPAVAAAAKCAPHLAVPLRERYKTIAGAMVLSTCNRVELLVETTPAANVEEIDKAVALGLFPHGFTSEATNPTCLRPVGDETTLHPIQIRRGDEVLEHIFAVAAGLDSMVVGEREISGQLRRALKVAQDQRVISSNLNRICQHALTTSRKVAHLTGLASQGRSVVASALDLAEEQLGNLRGEPALLIGTGSYAGASVSALRARDIGKISVYSSSGRARYFAAGHDLTPLTSEELPKALAEATVVISCRGLGSPALRKKTVEQALEMRKDQLLLLDLALQSDIEDGVGSLEQVDLINLCEIQRRLPEAGLQQLERAQEIIAQGVAEAASDLRDRSIGSVVVALRDSYRQILADEIARLPKAGQMDHDEVAYALRRLAARLAHTPTMNAHRAARQGHAKDYVQALHSVMGIEADFTQNACPVTGLSIENLEETPSESVPEWRKEAL